MQYNLVVQLEPSKDEEVTADELDRMQQEIGMKLKGILVQEIEDRGYKLPNTPPTSGLYGESALRKWWDEHGPDTFKK